MIGAMWHLSYAMLYVHCDLSNEHIGCAKNNSSAFAATELALIMVIVQCYAKIICVLTVIINQMGFRILN